VIDFRDKQSIVSLIVAVALYNGKEGVLDIGSKVDNKKGNLLGSLFRKVTTSSI
jgi:hypothetical protein